MTNVTRILSAIEQGDPHAAPQLLPLVYDELRKLAVARMARERADHTLQPTALVHEAYLRLVEGAAPNASWDSRGHFFAAAAEAMRRILVDRALRKRRPKHGGDRQRVDLEEAAAITNSPEELLALDEALAKLAREEPRKAKLVKLRFFAGLTIPEAAKMLGISTATAERYWSYARVWLYAELYESE
jgi:RNA polymerase sigma factor (TIGR02999 family)